MVTYDFNPRTLEAEAADLNEFEASLVVAICLKNVNVVLVISWN